MRGFGADGRYAVWTIPPCVMSRVGIGFPWPFLVGFGLFVPFFLPASFKPQSFFAMLFRTIDSRPVLIPSRVGVYSAAAYQF